MVAFQKHIIIYLIFIAATSSLNAQGHLFNEVKINKSKVYVGEPVEVSIGIYTSTWFTKGINFGNIKVNGAFTVYFRSVSTSKQINGKNYAGVIAIYNVFPYENKDISFPSLEFTVETPNEGQSQAVKRIVKTKAREIQVIPVPANFERNRWLVASNVSVSESWQGDLKNTKVGDVISRQVFTKAYGTVSELIPPLRWDSINTVSIYPSRAIINSEKTKTSISATRSEGVRYLFEKEGTLTLPAIEVTWWNSRQNKLFKRTLKERTIEVLPNPDLGMLETVKDSLQLSKQSLNDESNTETETEVFGMSLKDFLTYILIGLAALFAVIKFFHWLLIKKGLIEYWKKRKQAYLLSEKYFFKLFLKEANKNNPTLGLNALYQWIDRLDLEEPTIEYFVKRYGSNELFEALVKASKLKKFDPSQHKDQIKTARKNYLIVLKQSERKETTTWINP